MCGASAHISITTAAFKGKIETRLFSKTLCTVLCETTVVIALYECHDLTLGRYLIRCTHILLILAE